MRFFSLLTLGFALILTATAQQKPSRSVSPEYVPGQLVVQFEPTLSESERQFLIANMGARLSRRLLFSELYLLEVHPAADIRALCHSLSRVPGIKSADPNGYIQLAWNPDDPIFPNQVSLFTVGAPQAWDIFTGDPNYILAVLDTGALLSHEDLQAKLLNGFDFGGNASGVRDSDPSDVAGHGTIVSGIAGAVTNNSLGIACICPNSSILPVKVFRDSGQGILTDLIDGIAWAVQQGAHVINMSLGTNTVFAALETAVNNAWNSGTVVVAAAGNNNNSVAFYPAFYNNAIAVAACHQDGTKSNQSNFGNWVDVAAPSGDVRYTRITGGYGRDQNGFTSYASPMVAAQAALLYAMIADGPTDRNTTRAQIVRQIIEQTTTAVPGNYVTHGMINVNNAVQRASQVTVNGKVQIAGFIGAYDQLELQLHLRNIGSNTNLQSRTVTPDAEGNFSATFNGYFGNYDLYIDIPRALNKRIQNARMRHPGPSLNIIHFTPGDVNNDGIISDPDLISVLFDYSLTGSRNSDLNGDTIVGDADLLMVLFNFGSTEE
ncbi:MAG: S8 family serine peptidase [Fimbriimonadia bacterium]|nr:S8 family serine peptidase [Fimbriimonadia bacterium]